MVHFFNLQILGFKTITSYYMEKEELDESPIGSIGEEVVEIGSGSSDGDGDDNDSEEDEEILDSETFKGSFLQEMEKLCRPLKYQTRRHDIYSLAETSQEDILSCIDDNNEASEFRIDFDSSPEAYIIDFQADPQLECFCRCHKNKNIYKPCNFEINQRSQKGEKKMIDIIEQPKSMKGKTEQLEIEKPLKSDKDVPKKQPERNWTSLSLKEYKQRIKKKLQEKH